jgi:hypothetical protein
MTGMNDSHVTAFMLAQTHFMNVIYGLCALCVSYKMMFIIRQVPINYTLAANALRVTAAIVATIVLARAYSRFDGGDTAQWFDIIRELSWCGFLFAAIFVLRDKFGKF